MQTQKRRFSEIPFRIRRSRGNQVNVGELSQPASSNHALFFTESALVIKKKMPAISANQHSVILPRIYVCHKKLKSPVLSVSSQEQEIIGIYNTVRVPDAYGC